MSLWSALLARRTQPAADRPSLTLYFLLTGAFLLTLVPHAVQFPPWLSVALIAALILRSVIEVYRFPLPSTTFCGILALLLLGAILLQFHTVAGREAGTAFTAGLLTIKFYEMRRPRDVSLIIFSCFFMVMSALLYSQVLELFVYCLIMMWVLTALLLRVHTGDLPHDRLLRMLWKSGIIFVQALPLALVLFFFCPRYSGQFRLSLNEAQRALIREFVDSYLRLDATERVIYEQEVAKLATPEKEKVMAVINEWTEAALEQGREQGLTAGLSPFLRILRRTVGNLPVEVEEQVRRLSASQLEELADAQPALCSLADLRAWLARTG